MTPPFLTIAEAASKTSRSASTIRRVIRSIADKPTHPDRAGIFPSPDEVKAFKKKGENFTWKIREDIVMKNIDGAPREEKKKDAESSGGILDILRKELELKNGQIEKQWEVIHALNDRLREGNILMGSLQQRLAPPAKDSTTPSPVEAAAVHASEEVSKEIVKKAMKKPSTDVSTEPSMTASVKPAKKGILRWLRRS